MISKEWGDKEYIYYYDLDYIIFNDPERLGEARKVFKKTADAHQCMRTAGHLSGDCEAYRRWKKVHDDNSTKLFLLLEGHNVKEVLSL